MKGISAYNVNSGGGKVLLLALLQEFKDDEGFVCWLDERIQPSIPAMKGKVYFITPSFFHRLKAELRIYKFSFQLQSLLFFGNLPPLLPMGSSVTCYLFLQNRYIIQPDSINRTSWKACLRSIFERLWFKHFYRENLTCIVQNDSMKRLFHQEMGLDKKCRVMPFIADAILKPEVLSSEKRRNFIYIASPETHKNYSTLLEAFSILADENIFPSLTLVFNITLHYQLLENIKKICSKIGLDINVHDEVPHGQVPGIMKKHECLIYPSKMESFGLPLIEARELGLQIIASELDYVRDLLDPSESFDPNSAKSIARAIKRFLLLPEKREFIRTPRGFIKELDF